MYKYEIITPYNIDVDFVYSKLIEYFGDEYITVTSGTLYSDGNIFECKIFQFVGKSLYYEDMLNFRQAFDWYKMRYYKVRGVSEMIKSKENR